MKKNRRIVGDVVSILLGDGRYGFGRVLTDPMMAFYDFSSHKQPPIEQIISQPIAFRVFVDSEPIIIGRWPVVGHAPLEKSLLEKVWFYKQDIITKELTLYEDTTGEEVPATLEQCRKLERTTLWRTMHLEDRLQDHFAGRKDKWVEFAKSRLEG